MIPLGIRLKREMHRNIAIAQDLIMEEVYSAFNDAVLHGGTAIWRCYGGNRFSEDIDVYLKKDIKRVEQFFNSLEDKGFTIEKKKISKNSIFSKLIFNRTLVRFEAIFKTVRGSLRDYETSDGNFIAVYALSPEELIAKKVDTYLKRLKIRDLYDIYFLLRHVKDNTKISSKLKQLIKEFKPPIDEKDLKVIILEGLTPSTEKMLEYIKDRI